MTTLHFKHGQGFDGAIENEKGELIATIPAWGAQQQQHYGRLFAAAPDLLEACERAYELLIVPISGSQPHAAEVFRASEVLREAMKVVNRRIATHSVPSVTKSE